MAEPTDASAKEITRMRAFMSSFRIQCRVIGALIMRETWTRFGRENLGFAWLFAEFLIFAMPVLVLWHVVRGKYEHGLLVLPFAWAGYLPILLFRHIGSRMLNSVRLNMSLLYHRNVTPFDTVVARLAVEILGNYGAAIASFFLLYSIGQMMWPRDMPLLFSGYFYMTWWCVSVGLILAAYSERSVLFEKVWIPASYMYLPVSGFPYMAGWIPPKIRDVLLTFMPALPCYEMIRGGLFGPIVRVYYDVPWLTLTLAVMTLVGLLGLRDVRRHLVNQ